MPVSKKAKIQREHRKGDKDGTRAPVKANGLPVKAPKPTSIEGDGQYQLEAAGVHAETHDQKLWSKEKCWPEIFKATTTVTATA